MGKVILNITIFADQVCVRVCVYVCGGDRTRPMIDIKLDCLSSRKTIKCREEKFFFVLCEGNCYSMTYKEMYFSLTIRFSTTINWFCFGLNKLVLFWLQSTAPLPL